MNNRPHGAAANSADWPDLLDELDRWEEAGRIAPLWWRDDDAVAPSAQLDQLFAIAGDIPLALAVIPADATENLVAALRWHPDIAVLQHGWCHANHAISGKKSEYPDERHPVDVADELDEGRQRLRLLFGARALPVFVPPWNRFSERFVPLLAEARFIGLSRMASRPAAANPTTARGTMEAVAIIDAHIDLVAWRTTRGFVGRETALRQLVAELRARRETGSGEPIGILTHHLVMDAATGDFLVELADFVTGHPAARWAGVAELIGGRVPAHQVPVP